VPDLPLFTDNHVRGPLIKALRQRGRDEDILRKPDAFAYPIEYVKHPR
jgi:hypothetical protein